MNSYRLLPEGHRILQSDSAQCQRRDGTAERVCWSEKQRRSGAGGSVGGSVETHFSTCWPKIVYESQDLPPIIATAIMNSLRQPQI